MTIRADIAVIGGGIAGASAASELSAGATVVLLEAEDRCGVHATGRSAASFTEAYGSLLIRRLAMAGRRFLEEPPPGFAEVPLLRPRGMLTIGRADQAERVAAALQEGLAVAPVLRPVSPEEAEALVPVLRPGHVAAAFLEPDQREIDVDALHQGWLRLARMRGAQILTGAGVRALERRAAGWRIDTASGPVLAEVVVNAAGAWADQVAQMAGLPVVGLTPLRRTAFLIDAPSGSAGWPLVNDVDEAFYFKPDAGRLFVSPADATASAPMDAWPEELDIGIGAARLEDATTLKVTRVRHAWAGLRTFAPDRNPVLGMEQGLFWLAGQGGYGIKTAPALSRAAAGLILGRQMPDDLLAAGVTADALSHARFRNPK